MKDLVGGGGDRAIAFVLALLVAAAAMMRWFRSVFHLNSASYIWRGARAGPPMPKARSGWVILGLVCLAVIPYANSLTAGFTLDDEAVIRRNTAVTGGVDPIGILATPFLGYLYRPFTVLTFAINESLSPETAWPFHAVNVVFHAMVTLLVFRFAGRLFGSCRHALVAASLFAVHPIHTEAVTSLVGRAELLAALFSLVSLLTFERVDREVRWWKRAGLQVTSVVSFALAIMSKESALTALPLLPLFRVACRREAPLSGLWREIQSLDWVPYVMCAVVFVLQRLYVVGTLAPYTVTPLDNVLAFVPWSVRVRTALAVVWDYFGLLNVPLLLAADYSFPQVGTVPWWSPRFFGGLMLVLVSGALFVRQRPPSLALAAIFPFVTLSMTANVLFPIGTIKAERLLYFPSVGYVLLMSYAIDRAMSGGRQRVVVVSALAGLVAGFAVRTWDRNWDWQNNRELGQSMAWTAPDSAKSRYNFATALQDVDSDKAGREFRRALELYPAMEDAAVGLALLAEKRGATDEAIGWYRQALAIAPDCAQAHTNLCHLFLTVGRNEEAVEACRRGLRYKPADANLLAGLGHGFIGMGLRAKGLEVFHRSLALNAQNGELRTYVASLERAAPGVIPAGETMTVQ